VPCLDLLKKFIQEFHLLLPFPQDVDLLNVLLGEFYHKTNGWFEDRRLKFCKSSLTLLTEGNLHLTWIIRSLHIIIMGLVYLHKSYSTTWYYYTLFSCVRFDGELTVDTVTNWFATTVLALPQINYYSRESLVICLNYEGSFSFL